jgi:hypothetical protein
VSETRTGTGPRSVTHTYDAVGNRTQRVRNGTPTRLPTTSTTGSSPPAPQPTRGMRTATW